MFTIETAILGSCIRLGYEVYNTACLAANNRSECMALGRNVQNIARVLEDMLQGMRDWPPGLLEVLQGLQDTLAAVGDFIRKWSKRSALLRWLYARQLKYEFELIHRDLTIQLNALTLPALKMQINIANTIDKIKQDLQQLPSFDGQEEQISSRLRAEFRAHRQSSQEVFEEVFSNLLQQFMKALDDRAPIIAQIAAQVPTHVLTGKPVVANGVVLGQPVPTPSTATNSNAPQNSDATATRSISQSSSEHDAQDGMLSQLPSISFNTIDSEAPSASCIVSSFPSSAAQDQKADVSASSTAAETTQGAADSNASQSVSVATALRNVSNDASKFALFQPSVANVFDLVPSRFASAPVSAADARSPPTLQPQQSASAAEVKTTFVLAREQIYNGVEDMSDLFGDMTVSSSTTAADLHASSSATAQQADQSSSATGYASWSRCGGKHNLDGVQAKTPLSITEAARKDAAALASSRARSRGSARTTLLASMPSLAHSLHASMMRCPGIEKVSEQVKKEMQSAIPELAAERDSAAANNDQEEAEFLSCVLTQFEKIEEVACALQECSSMSPTELQELSAVHARMVAMETVAEESECSSESCSSLRAPHSRCSESGDEYRLWHHSMARESKDRALAASVHTHRDGYQFSSMPPMAKATHLQDQFTSHSRFDTVDPNDDPMRLSNASGISMHTDVLMDSKPSTSSRSWHARSQTPDTARSFQLQLQTPNVVKTFEIHGSDRYAAQRLAAAVDAQTNACEVTIVGTIRMPRPLVICNTYTKLVGGCIAFDAGNGVVLAGQNVDVQGTIITGNVRVHPNTQPMAVNLNGCELQNNHTNEYSLIVAGNTSVSVTDCNLMGCMGVSSKPDKRSGVVQIVGSQAKVCMRDTKVHDCLGAVVFVQDGAYLELSGCQVFGSRKLHGVCIDGPNTLLVARDSDIFDHYQNCVYVMNQACIKFSKCTVRNSQSYVGVCAKGRQCKLELLDCTLKDHKVACLAVMKESVAKVLGGRIEGQNMQMGCILASAQSMLYVDRNVVVSDNSISQLGAAVQYI